MDTPGMIRHRRATGTGRADLGTIKMSMLVPLIFSLLLVVPAIVSGSAPTVSIGEFFSESDVTAPLMINGVQDLAGATVKVSYDPAAVLVTAIAKGDLGTYTSNLNYAQGGWVKLMAYLVGSGRSGNVRFAELTISPQGSYGAYSTLQIEVETLSDTEYRTIDADVIAGFFYRGMNGDVHADRVIDALDSESIARGLAGDPGYPLKFGPSEVSGDGILDAYDCVYLTRHAAGIPGYETLH